MNKQMLLLPLIIGLVSAPLYAGEYHHHDSFQDKARVVEVIPLYETVEVPAEHRECWNEEVHNARGGGAGIVAGSIIGGVIGNQLGRGDGRKLATVAGTVIGAAVGANATRQARHKPSTEPRCQVHTDYVLKEHLRAYQVTYHYHGETFVTEMDHHPGKFVPVWVQVSLIE